MMELISDYNNYSYSICVHSNEELPPESKCMIVSSIIMIIEENVMHVTFGNPYHYNYLKYVL